MTFLGVELKVNLNDYFSLLNFKSFFLCYLIVTSIFCFTFTYFSVTTFHTSTILIFDSILSTGGLIRMDPEECKAFRQAQAIQGMLMANIAVFFSPIFRAICSCTLCLQDTQLIGLQFHFPPQFHENLKLTFLLC